MTDHGDRLREAFARTESQTPDAGDVYARVVELSRKHKYRRRGATAVGGVALGAGLIAAVVNLPAILPGDPQSGTGTSATAPFVAGAPASPAPSASSADQQDKDLQAYWDAGYTGDDVEALAKLWKMSPDDYLGVKTEAGRRLLAGETLPIRPQPVQETPASVAKFFDAGYSVDDAATLAKLWHLKTPYDAKVAGGEKLLRGETLPIKPHPSAEQIEEKRVSAFFDAHYTIADATRLAKLWHLKTAYDAKVLGGKKLLAGQTLPIKP
ncbi:hypothetical protein ACWT_5461 [Actinoplanes sp. SE50]|uniref:hypothetical protein n=1 Tax=unclassified Actinoplanes TaxID=2626549 RepID=UPI00023EC846|nr:MULTISPECIES: hypothetical protein [unclassified Actinoplanes]AEV86478.1 hypothetical protein ACPL_5591 [Actinoplanes sp. SE50/110]ATO84876.1 hypothetical protein ACWT_5461 [Actinoplanes sp. SE50]SLM02285.1 hypothetical protein ACSP50_5524 [Actinoplanes sp. SE50/110]